MSRWIKASIVFLLVLAILPAMPAQAQANDSCTDFGTRPNGAIYCITMPPEGMRNGDLVIFAHGYVPVNAPLDIPWSQMTFSDGLGGIITLPALLNSKGYAFATTSYSVNGLAVQQGISDIHDLVDVFVAKYGTPNHIYLVGASEGGLITTLAIEQDIVDNTFSGGLAICGPIGSFTGQVNYWGDFRVVFDYFMDRPGFNVLPGSAVDIPQVMMNKWNSVYVHRIESSLTSRPTETMQLMSVAKAPFDTNNLNTIGLTTRDVLWYNAFATNDAIRKLGGQPFDNHDRVYSGSLNDPLLNRKVKRFSADPIALAEIAAKYETSGILMRPLVTMHTTGDPIVPFWHQTTYTVKVLTNNPPFPYIPPYMFNTINRYGHCNFTLTEMLNGFGQLVYMTTGFIPPTMPQALQAEEPQTDTYYYDYH